MRLFIAVPLPRDVQKKVFAFEQELRAASTGDRFVPQGARKKLLEFCGLLPEQIADKIMEKWTGLS